jgi:hypothetical protein
MTLTNILRMSISMATSRWAVALVFAGSLSASNITIGAGGTFTAATGTSTFSAPDETWSFSFAVDPQPAVSNASPDNYFDVAFTDFNYSLNNSPVTITPVDIRFFSASQFGGFNICFITACSFFDDPANGLEFEGPQMYQGSTSTPTMLVGDFTAAFVDEFADSIEYNQPSHQAIMATATPEPSVIWPCVTAFLLALAGQRARQRG